MIKIVFYTYIFVRWMGGWGYHTGIGAVLFFLLWVAFMALSVCMAATGPLLTIVSICKLFKVDTRQIQRTIVILLRNPSGRAILFGHWGTMGLTALICFVGYFFTGSNAACLVHWDAPGVFEWVLLIWYGYSVYSFFKNVESFMSILD